MSQRDSTRYDKYLGLFRGDDAKAQNDRRGRLVLDALFDVWIQQGRSEELDLAQIVTSNQGWEGSNLHSWLAIHDPITPSKKTDEVQAFIADVNLVANGKNAAAALQAMGNGTDDTAKFMRALLGKDVARLGITGGKIGPLSVTAALMTTAIALNEVAKIAYLKTVTEVTLANPFVDIFKALAAENSDGTNLDWVKKYSAGAALDPAAAVASFQGPDDFTFQPNKHMMKRLWELTRNRASAAQASASFFGSSTSATYTRNADGDLVNSNGDKVGPGSVKQKGLTAADGCFTSLLEKKGTAPKTCSQYFNDCLLGKDVDKCKEFIKNDDYWPALAADVEKMSPVIARETLDKFGFQANSNNGVVTVEDVGSWLGRLEGEPFKFNAADATQVRNNKKLVAYLQAVVALINGNPAILNKEGKVATIVNTKAAAYGIRAKQFKPTMNLASLYRLRNAISVDAMRNSILFGVSNIGTILVGGGALEDIEFAANNPTAWTSQIFKDLIKGTEEALNSQGKKIQEGDRKTIADLISKLEDSERKLYSTMKYAARYVRLLEMYGERDGEDVLNMDHLKKFVDARNKYFVKTNKRTNGLMQVLINLQSAVEGQSVDTSTLVPMPTV
jgi:hypothetical protein